MEAGGRPPTPPEGEPSTQATVPSSGAQPATAKPVAVEPVEERIEGLRAWIAQLDRKLSIRSFAGGAALVLALAAGIVGVVLALSAKDESATKDEVRSLRDQVEAVQEEASKAAEDDLATLTERLDALEGRINSIAGGQRTTESELSVVQDDIDDLRSQISDLKSSAAADTGGTGGSTQGP